MMIRMIAVGIADNDFAIRGCPAATCDLSVACAGAVLSDANSFAVGAPGDPSGSHDVAGSSVAAGISPRAFAWAQLTFSHLSRRGATHLTPWCAGVLWQGDDAVHLLVQKHDVETSTIS